MGLWGVQRLGAKWKKVVMLPLFFSVSFFFLAASSKKIDDRSLPVRAATRSLQAEWGLLQQQLQKLIGQRAAEGTKYRFAVCKIHFALQSTHQRDSERPDRVGRTSRPGATVTGTS